MDQTAAVDPTVNALAVREGVAAHVSVPVEVLVTAQLVNANVDQNASALAVGKVASVATNVAVEPNASVVMIANVPAVQEQRAASVPVEGLASVQLENANVAQSASAQAVEPRAVSVETNAAVDLNASVGRVASVNRASVEHCDNRT